MGLAASPKKLKVVDPENAVPVEILAESIKQISEGTTKLLNGPLKRNAVVILIQHATARDSRGRLIGVREIEAVLDGMESLRKKCVK